MLGCKAMADSTTPRPAEVQRPLALDPIPKRSQRRPQPLTNAADAAFLVWARAHLGTAQAGQHSHPAADHAAALPVPAPTLAVAYSGGADSTALLLAAHHHWPGPLVALHVHHGLQSAADHFEQHCIAQCERLQRPLRIAHVDARHAAGESPEERARQHRYRALADLAREAGAAIVVLAQHADDQVETLMLALSRGAGMAGLAAMPAHFERHHMRFARPLLGVRSTQIRQDLQAADVAYVEDPSNRDPALTRNRIRQRLLPALAQTFTSFHETFARTARHAAQAQLLLDQLAEEDLQQLGQPPLIAQLRRLSRPRQANVLRHWLKTRSGSPGSTAQLEALLDQIAACTTRGHRIELKIAHGHVRREGSHLTYHEGLL